MKVNELEGAELNDWVRNAENNIMTPVFFEPSKNWSDAGPIIEREKISIEYIPPNEHGWMATISHDAGYAHEVDASACGPTPLIAAMRCYVASKFGDEVD